MKVSTMVTRALLLLLNILIIIELMGHLLVIEVHGDNSFGRSIRGHFFHQGQVVDHYVKKMEAFKESISAPPSMLISPSPAFDPPMGQSRSGRVYHVASYGADPTGKSDSTEALLRVFTDVSESVNNNNNNGYLMEGITNLGGLEINLDGGTYLISRPLQFPTLHLGNILIHGGTLRASDNFGTNRYLIELSLPSSPQNLITASSTSSYNFEYITFRDLMLDCNFRGGGILVTNSLRIGIDNCFITHFMTEGILIQSGHETLIRSSFIGQHITAGNHPGERNFSGTGITLNGNDNVVTDVMIFSAETGIMVSGQANLLSGVHCYNKAYGFGGTGIYLKLPGLTQTRIVNSYLDYTGIVAEDPFQLIVSNNFFLGDAFISLKSVKGIARGVNIVDNIFSGSGKGIDIVQLDGSFGDVDQVLVDRNNANGMNMKATIARAAVKGNATSWTADFNGVLLFPNLIKHVHYTLSTDGESFPSYALRNVSNNQVVIESNLVAPTSVYVTVDQGGGK
ncbi:polygalacturonase QRT3-like [Silene latifolia]|uniref:polygalacturonase QRT3-like n=1 Tax=Silene latifolia TaxID=37657 RepID=UPI003D77271C